MKRKKRIGVLTGGGDCPGLNAVIRAVVRSAHSLGWETVGIQESFGGLLNTKKTRLLRPVDVRGILHTGGTILGTTNHGNPFEFPEKDVARVSSMPTVSPDVFRKTSRKLGLDGLIVIGGDGTLRIGFRFFEMGLPVIGVPKTIDNDVAATSGHIRLR